MSRVRIPVRKGTLSKYITEPGKRYTELPASTRKQVLKRAIKNGEDPASLLKKLQVMVTMRKNKTDKKTVSVRKKFENDRNWIKSNYF